MSTSRSKTVRQNDRPLKAGKPESAAPINVRGDDLIDRVFSILAQARANVVSAVNSNMVIAQDCSGASVRQEIKRDVNEVTRWNHLLNSRHPD